MLIINGKAEIDAQDFASLIRKITIQDRRIKELEAIFEEITDYMNEERKAVLSKGNYFCVIGAEQIYRALGYDWEAIQRGDDLVQDE